jgi:hypothetical protein
MSTNAVPNQVIVEDVRIDVNVDQDVPNLITLNAGSSQTVLTRRHVHSQPVVSDVWIIDHPLNGKPSVTIVDSADTVVVGEVTYNSNSRVTVTFTAPFSGYAYLT